MSRSCRSLSGNGAAGALIVILLWTYYSAQIFLFGSEVTKAIADARSDKAEPARDAQTPQHVQSARLPAYDLLRWIIPYLCGTHGSASKLNPRPDRRA